MSQDGEQMKFLQAWLIVGPLEICTLCVASRNEPCGIFQHTALVEHDAWPPHVTNEAWGPLFKWKPRDRGGSLSVVITQTSSIQAAVTRGPYTWMVLVSRPLKYHYMRTFSYSSPFLFHMFKTDKLHPDVSHILDHPFSLPYVVEFTFIICHRKQLFG